MIGLSTGDVCSELDQALKKIEQMKTSHSNELGELKTLCIDNHCKIEEHKLSLSSMEQKNSALNVKHQVGG